jgi:hypothetical protein
MVGTGLFAPLFLILTYLMKLDGSHLCVGAKEPQVPTFLDTSANVRTKSYQLPVTSW